MCKRWTPDEDKILKSLYPYGSKRDISNKMGKPWERIVSRARRLGLKRSTELINEDKKIRGPRKDAWSKEEEKLLQEIYPKSSKDEIISKMKRPWRGIWSRAYHLGLHRDPEILKKEMIEGGKNAPPNSGVWSEKDTKLLRNIYESNSKKFILSKINKTWRAIRYRALCLGIRRNIDIVKQDNVEGTSDSVMKKYGVRYTTQLPEMKRKSRKTNLERRGVEYPTQCQEVRDKIKTVVREKYGVDFVAQSEEVKDTIKATNIERYGVENALQNPRIHEKLERTNETKYGVKNPFQLVDRVQNGMMKKYGVVSPLKSPIIAEKARKTNMNRYGGPTPFQSPMIVDKIKETCLARYGVAHPLLSPEIKKKIYETTKKNGFDKSNPETAFFEYLKAIDEKTEHNVFHPVHFYKIDFYMPKFDMWIQFDGVYWHGKKMRNNIKEGPQYTGILKTVERDALQAKLIPNLIRFWEDDVDSAIKNDTILDLIEETLFSKKTELLSKSEESHQHIKKMELYDDEVKNLDFNPEQINTSDLIIANEPFSFEISDFIKKYEWLGTTGVSPKWCFTARFKENIAGVVLINEPTAYSKLLGKDTPKYEALIQRGATSSWAPKNTGSKMIMFSCRWMVSNTDKRLFIGYGDPQAKEKGIIYQACGFEYLGNTFGNKFLYSHPSIRSGKPFSSQSLKRTSAFISWCKSESIATDPSWFKENKFKDMQTIPENVKNKWYSWNKKILSESNKIPIETKHKYVLLLSTDKREKMVLEGLKEYCAKSYPKK